jgi:hypothetical protein
MPADQHMGFGTAIRQRHHQLLRMPEGDNHPLTLRKQPIHALRSFDAHAHSAA